MPTIAYTTARILLFVASPACCTWPAPGACCCSVPALLISGVVSYVVLSRQRDAMSSAITSRMQGVRGRAGSTRAPAPKTTTDRSADARQRACHGRAPSGMSSGRAASRRR